jgi:hypothetical protein
MHHNQDHGSVEIGSDCATIRTPGGSTLISAKILHREVDAQGSVRCVTLDRMVHGRFTSRLGSWDTTGAITTILTLR